jgi:hypothetical protein
MPTPAEMAAVFERIRAAVLQEATRPSPYDAKQHAENQAKFTRKLDDLCKNAHLRADMTADDLWWQVWRMIRYAGFRAAFVTGEIGPLTPFFKDFRALTGPEWRFDPTGIGLKLDAQRQLAHGEAVREFLNRTGRFAGISYNYNRSPRKLHTILKAAAAFQAFPPGAQALAALFGDDYDKPGDGAFCLAHERLAKLVGFTTALHVMMDIGFNCVKPDIWLVRLMCRLGWIEDTLPAASTETVIEKNYQKPRIAVAVIKCARRIAEAMHAWHPEAPLREFDFVMVKYGQKPGECGIVRSLHNEWRPVQQIMEWHP